MNSISIFSLEKHEGPYETWPLKTKLYIDNEPTKTYISGYSLLHQFKTACGYLLITDDDCPFEERTTVTLLNKKLRIISYRMFFIPFGSYLLTNIMWLDEKHLVLSFYEDEHKLITIRRLGIPYIFPRLKVQRYFIAQRFS